VRPTSICSFGRLQTQRARLETTGLRVLQEVEEIVADAAVDICLEARVSAVGKKGGGGLMEFETSQQINETRSVIFSVT